MKQLQNCEVNKKTKFNEEKPMSMSQLVDMIVPNSILLCHDGSYTQSQIEYHVRRPINQNSYISNYVVQKHVQSTHIPKRQR